MEADLTAHLPKTYTYLNSSEQVSKIGCGPTLIFDKEGKNLVLQGFLTAKPQQPPEPYSLLWDFKTGKLKTLRGVAGTLGWNGGSLGLTPEVEKSMRRRFGDKFPEGKLGKFPEGTVLSPDGKTVASYFPPNQSVHLHSPEILKKARAIQIWDFATGKPEGSFDIKIELKPSRSDGIRNVAFSPDGKILAAATLITSTNSGFIHLWDLRTRKEIITFKVNFRPVALAFSRDGNLLASAGGGGEIAGLIVRVWEVPSPGDLNTPIEKKK